MVDKLDRRPGVVAAVTMVVLLLASLFTLSACGSDESREDADDVGNGQVEKAAPSVIAFNNHFPNVQIKCDGFGDLLLTITHDDGKSPNLTVLPGHPRCTGEGKSFQDFLDTGEQPDRRWVPPTDPRLYPQSAAVAP
jgi:hypothetical protein